MLLSVQDIHAYYGKSHILQGVSLEASAGEIVALLGRNGVGKSSTLKSIMGINPPKRGHIYFSDGDKDVDITHMPPFKTAQLGIGYVPEDRRIFKQLTVIENLELPVRGGNGQGWPMEQVFHYFPILKARKTHRGSELSGGEQQMLAIARILRTDVRILLLDEPTEGLAPLLVGAIGDILGQLKEMGKTMLLVEQNIRFALDLANRHYILSQGRIIYEGTDEELQQNKEVLKKYLGV